MYYLFGVPQGTWHIRATAPGMSLSPVGWSNPLTVTGNMPDKHFAKDAVQSWAISGKVTDLGQPMPGVIVSTGAASVLSDTAGQYVIPGLVNGSYTVTAAGMGSDAGITFTPPLHNVTVNGADVTGKDFATTRVDPPPTIAIAASANPNPVPGTKTTLSVLGADDYGEDLLWYKWTLVGTPPAAVSFSVNGAHAASQTVATFTKAGTYTFRANVFDQRGGVATSDVVVEVLQTPTSIAVTPLNPTIIQGASQQFTAALKDQFGFDVPNQPEFTWSVDGGGTINSTGLFVSDGTLGAFTVTAAGGGLEGQSLVKIKAPPGPGSGVTRELFSGIEGANVGDLTGHVSFPNAPTSANVLSNVFEATASADNYGQRVRGWFVAPGDGQYIFYIASDDRSELYLSTDESPANKVKIAEVPSFAAPRDWTKYPQQKSGAITLVGGHQYYIEALHKEADGGDHVEVGVETPGGVEEKPIPADRLIPLPIVSITAATPTTPEGSTTPGKFTLTRSGSTASDLAVNVVIGGSASAGEDYDAIATTVTIPSGASSTTVEVKSISDDIAEGDENVTMTLLNGSVYAIGADRAAAVTIMDDDLVVTIAATDPQATEPVAAPALPPGWENYPEEFGAPAGAPLGVPDTGTFTVTLSKPILVDRVIAYSVSGTATPDSDYESLSGVVTIRAGETSAEIIVTPLADNIAEVAETVSVELSAGSGYSLGAASSATVMIGDGSAVAPTLTATALDGRRIQLQWNDALANEDGFELQRLVSGNWTTIHTSAANQTTFVHDGLTPATLLTYRVRGVSAGQHTDWSNAATATTWKPGDATGDGKVNFADFQRVERRFGKTGASWADGDFSGDGVVNHVDFVILFSQFGN
jgi:hypothetical protein